MDNFFVRNIELTGKIVLETIHIISTSKNIETIKNRYAILLDNIEALKQSQSNPEYSQGVQASINMYKSLYHDRVIQDYQLAVLSKPNDFNVTEFYCNALVNGTKKITIDETQEINAMKRESAKAKRKVKVIEILESAKAELQNKCSSALSYSLALAEINKLERTINPGI